MTHYELMARLNDYGYGVPPLNALRAVVELHKPRTDEKVCPLCSKKRFWVTYPCETIQAVERELA